MTLPRATYRLQLHRDFGFDAAARLAPYLARLGVSHVYSSPCLKARPGSRHGYDIVAHDEVNPELGGAAALANLAVTLRAAGLGHLADVVPNHMGVWGADNRLWLDVLAWGQDSRYAGWFDIDWEPDRRYLQDKLLAPILADQYGIELEAGHLELRFDALIGEFALWCYGTHRLPICPLHYEGILGDEHYGLQELGDDFSALPEWRPQMAQRATELQQQLVATVASDPAAQAALAAALGRFNGAGQGDPRPLLDALIQRQHWRVTHFRVAGDDINYRRFFNVNELAGLRVELPAVFTHVHQLPLRWLAEGVADGLRIDHIDGLLDPPGYLERLRAAMTAAMPPGTTAYLAVEKILAPGEQLPPDWPVDGTTGYEFGALVTAWLVDPAGQPALDALYEQSARGGPAWEALVRACKLHVMDNEMTAELNVLARDASRVARQSARTADFTRNILRRAIRAFVAALPVYRTYMRANGDVVPEERQRLAAAIAAARDSEPELDASVFHFLLQLLAGELLGPRSLYTRHAVIRCARKLQQYSGPVMAKGLEDTALYRYSRLLALNDVGTDPQRFGLDNDALHAANATRPTRTLLASSTHDSKQGEDARARLAVLSELPAAWADFTVAALASLRRDMPTAVLPARDDLYALLQRLVASWPAEWTQADWSPDGASGPANARAAYAARLQEATVKALREAKLRSSWTLPRAGYEQAMTQAVERILQWLLAPDASPARTFLARVAALGAHNSLAQLALKLTVPGIPDFYQGCEGWNFSLMDPDNRRAVDFDAFAALLRTLEAQPEPEERELLHALRHWQDGAIKLRVTHRLLQHRRTHAALFESGDYLPVAIQGAAREQLFAFVRRLGRQALLVVVARFPARWMESGASWDDTTLQLPDPALQGDYRCLLSGRVESLRVTSPAAHLLRSLPMAILYRD